MDDTKDPHIHEFNFDFTLYKMMMFTNRTLYFFEWLIIIINIMLMVGLIGNNVLTNFI